MALLVLSTAQGLTPTQRQSLAVLWVEGNTSSSILVDDWNGSGTLRFPLVLVVGGDATQDPYNVANGPVNWRLPSDFEPEFNPSIAELLRVGDVVQLNGARYIVGDTTLVDLRTSPDTSPAYSAV